MIANDILRLAGLDITISPEPEPTEVPVADLPCTNSIKYNLINIIEYYNNECEKSKSENVKLVYCEIIKHIDNVLGLILQNKCDEAKAVFNLLDDNIKCALMKYDEDIAHFFNIPYTTESKKIKITKLKESKNEVIDLEDTLYHEEKPVVKKITVPADVIKDIKMKIKELDDGNNHDYTAHLSGFDIQNQQYEFAKKVLENILDYLINPDESSIKYVTIYISSLDSIMKSYVPVSVWKFLSISYSPGTSIKDILTAKKGAK